MIDLKTTIATSGGIAAAVWILVNIIKSFSTLSGRATHIAVFSLSIFLAVVGGACYGVRPVDWPQTIWVGIMAGAEAIGIDQTLKRGNV